MNCRVCFFQISGVPFFLRDNLYDNTKKYKYYLCKYCGVLQLADEIIDISESYPKNYYSFVSQTQNRTCKKDAGKNIFAKIFLSKLNVFYKISWFGQRIPPFLLWLKRVNVKQKSRILDIGCGNGDLLFWMKKYGFKDLTGIDPFIESEVIVDENLKIYKSDIESLNQKYDFVMLNHSFEHMPDPHSVFRVLNSILKIKSYVMIRIPIIDSFAWEYYKENWIQLDAPRHIITYSIRAINILADKYNFTVKDIVYDSNEFQFWGSEQNKIGVMLTSPESYSSFPSSSIFTEKQIYKYKKMAHKLNNQGRGDSVAVYLYKN